MTRGIYITANDKFTQEAIALLNSIRLYDPEVPVILIPYDDQYESIAQILHERFGVQVYEDLEFIDRLSNKLYQIFGQGFFARPNQFRKQACWFGPFDEFLYIDTDIVVFEKIADNLNYLADYDFICADYQYSKGIQDVFAPAILEAGVFTQSEIQDIFNCGFWGSKKHRISEAELYETFAECAAHPEYFDFSRKTSDQPIINYMILKRISKRFNVVRRPGKAPGNWAGSPHFVLDDSGLDDSVLGDSVAIDGKIKRLIDPKNNQPLQYLHWAGIRIRSGCPYWEVWEHYRYLNEPKPEVPPQSQPQRLGLKQQLARLKKAISR